MIDGLEGGSRPLLDSALAYAARGWHVLPLHTVSRGLCSCLKARCPNSGKHPRHDLAILPNGLTDASTDELLIRRWWRRWPDANVGIATGAISNLVVLDIDPRHAGDASLEELQRSRGVLPATVEVGTGGGGRHLFFSHPGDGDVRNSAGTLGVGLDVRGDGGYVVAPPSLHASGNRYLWEVSSNPDDVAITAAPAWLIAAMRGPQRALPMDGDDRDPIIRGANLPLSKRTLEFVAMGAPIGQQRSRAVSAARNYLGAGYCIEQTIEHIWKGLDASPKEPDREPWTEEQASKLVRSVAKSAPPPLADPPTTTTAAAPLAQAEIEDGELVDEPEDVRAEKIDDAEAEPEPEDIPYKETRHGIQRIKFTERNGRVTERVTNFTARIVADVLEDDGESSRRIYDLRARLGTRRFRFTVPAADFKTLGWVDEHLGGRAIVYPGQSNTDHARTAIKLLSGTSMEERTVYAHTGWRKVGEEWCYLHGSGAIGAAGVLTQVEVRLPRRLAPFDLPEPPEGDQLVAAIRASMALLDLAPDLITVPVLGAVFRAPLAETDFSLHLTGGTGNHKTAFAALAQSHFGAGFDERHLPGSWRDTSNAAQGLAFVAKDAVMVVDDFAPGGSQTDIQRMHRDADNLFRSKGNNVGRLRMTDQARLKDARPPRALLISSGEDTPRGQSVRARLLIIEIAKGDISKATLTVCQHHAREGIYAQAFAGFVRWLAPRYEEIKHGVRPRMEQLRAKAMRSGSHSRTPGAIADVFVGLETWIRFAQEAGALDTTAADRLANRCWTALGKLAGQQPGHQGTADVARRFLALLVDGLQAGRFHLAATDGGEPSDPELWGWRRTARGGAYPREEWLPGGSRIGWLRGENVYLLPEATFGDVQRFASQQGTPIELSQETVWRRLDERHMFASHETGRFTIKREVQDEGARSLSPRVLHLLTTALYGPPVTDVGAAQVGPPCIHVGSVGSVGSEVDA